MSQEKTILLIDDDDFVCEMTREVLEKLGHKVVVAMSAEEALNLLADSRRRFDLIMVDHLLSDASGIDLASDILRICPNAPVVL